MSSKTQRQRRRRRRRWLMRKLTLIIFNTISHTLHIQYHPHHALGIWQWATFCGCVSVSAMQLCALSRSEENSNYIWLLAFVSLLIKVIRMNLSGFHQRDGRKRRTNSQQCWWIFSIHRTRSHQRFFFFPIPVWQVAASMWISMEAEWIQVLVENFLLFLLVKFSSVNQGSQFMGIAIMNNQFRYYALWSQFIWNPFWRMIAPTDRHTAV